jgi:hypothetical protein
MEWEHWQEGLRLASRALVPWDNSNVAIICIKRDGQIRAMHNVTGKREMLERAARADMLLVTWPGARRQDVFIVDDRRAALLSPNAR